jgi:hypothetical protein
VELNAIPHIFSAAHPVLAGGLVQLGSRVAANPGMSEIKLVCAYFCALARLVKARHTTRHITQSLDRMHEEFITDIAFSWESNRRS